MSDRITMVEDGDDNSKFGQQPLATLGPLSGTEEKGQQVLPTSGSPRPGQDSKLILPEMPLPPELPADD
ncbi:hypothetical protein ACGFIF_43055 [Kribbella sp. NPDC049174]|uniref:hypothetical protein n=1 Tax=Kribbella sp. NPDC049174 TaxID=3364112 RepID=UPI00371FCBA7